MPDSTDCCSNCPPEACLPYVVHVLREKIFPRNAIWKSKKRYCGAGQGFKCLLALSDLSFRLLVFNTRKYRMRDRVPAYGHAQALQLPHLTRRHHQGSVQASTALLCNS